MATPRVIEIYHIELRLYLVFIQVLQQLVIGYDGEVIEFIII